MISSRFKFTQLTAKLKYPPVFKGVLSTYHSKIVTFVQQNYQNKSAYRNQVTKVLNLISFLVISGDTIPSNWNLDDPLINVPDIDDDILSRYLSRYDLYIVPADIDWDILEAETSTSSSDVEVRSATKPIIRPSISNEPNKSVEPTPKEDLYIQSPKIPQFNYDKIWAQGLIDNTHYAIYASRPEIPTRQTEISVTTDVNKMLTSDLMKLFPNRIIHTRSEVMYTPVDGLEFDPELGVILPIKGFTAKQLRDNLIKYPHIYHLSREIDGQLQSFYSAIEIDHQLYPTLDIWDTLSDVKQIPKTSEYIKEYVVRRYLLERDIKRIEHSYPLFGSLQPYLTLFAPPDVYSEWGYTDSADLARQCVLSRVSYKQTRNPVLRRLSHG